jgi:hypothetical protein
MGFNLDDYEPVAARLARWLEQTEGQPRVLTHLVHYQENRCVFRAELWVGDVLISTGWAEETRGDGNVNRTSHLENAETSSVGRALSNAGLAGADPSKRPSREEMAKVARAGGSTPSGSGSSSGAATDKQKGFIRKLAWDKGCKDGDSVTAAIADVLGVDVQLHDLTAGQASRVIEAWKAEA